MNELRMNDIFKIRELAVCRKVQIDEKTAFTRHELMSGDEFREHNLPLNYIIFVLEGRMEVICNQYRKCLVPSNRMVLLLRTSSVYVKALQQTTLYVLYFDILVSSCDQQILNTYLPDAEKITYEFKPITIPEPIIRFLAQIQYFQALKVDCTHFNSLKHCEFFLLLRHFCPRADFVMFLAPLIGRSVQFRNKVLEKYTQLGNGRITEFARLVGMGRKNFEKQFRKEFGISPARWILQEKAKHLYMFLTEPDITIADAMDRFYFNSAAHFNHFCVQHYNKTPGMIIQEARQQTEKETTTS